MLLYPASSLQSYIGLHHCRVYGSSKLSSAAPHVRNGASQKISTGIHQCRRHVLYTRAVHADMQVADQSELSGDLGSHVVSYPHHV